ncbi:hypothetical protein ABGB19_20455 [Mycobacterium sp. B14F4]|uniref:hypothetical protein n=1 Tax=Mycobacterium sp. B14F4 TaxID=3153565 RepID=UPI00325DF920
MTVKKIGAQAALVGALGFTALGVGAGVANAEQPLPSTPGMSWKLDKDWDDWDDRGWRRWDEPRYWNGPQYGGACAWVPPAVSMWVPPAVC